MTYHRGFSLIELMIVLTIIGILTAIAIPSYQQYIDRARFIELITTAHTFKTAVTVALQEGFPLNELTTGVHGIPLPPKKTRNLDHLSIEKGIITAFGTESLKNITYILKPNEDGSDWRISGTCLKAELCHG